MNANVAFSGIGKWQSCFSQTRKSVKSAAFSIPSIWNTDFDFDFEEIKNQLREIAKEMLAMDGFIGLSLASAVGCGVTNSISDNLRIFARLLKAPPSVM